MSKEELILRTLSRKIRERMTSRNIDDIRKLSHLTGLSTGALSALLNGRGNPTLSTLITLCTALDLMDLSLASLYGGGCR